jgi:hypothetical protein
LIPPLSMKALSRRVNCRPSRPVARWMSTISALAAAMSSRFSSQGSNFSF